MTARLESESSVCVVDTLWNRIFSASFYKMLCEGVTDLQAVASRSQKKPLFIVAAFLLSVYPVGSHQQVLSETGFYHSTLI